MLANCSFLASRCALVHPAAPRGLLAALNTRTMNRAQRFVSPRQHRVPNKTPVLAPAWSAMTVQFRRDANSPIHPDALPLLLNIDILAHLPEIQLYTGDSALSNLSMNIEYRTNNRTRQPAPVHKIHIVPQKGGRRQGGGVVTANAK